MHECTFPIWVISIIVAAVFSVIVGIFDLRLPKTASGRDIIDENNVIRATSRVGPSKVLLIDFVLSAVAAGLFLWQYFATAEASFSGFWPIVGSICVILLTIVVMGAAWIILFLLYNFFSYIRESFVEAKYSFIKNAEVTITFID